MEGHVGQPIPYTITDLILPTSHVCNSCVYFLLTLMSPEVEFTSMVCLFFPLPLY